MMVRWFTLVIFLLPCLLQAQPSNFANIKSISTTYDSLIYSKYYDGNSLWGYMDGGADLYLEYGFEGVLVQEIISDGVQLKCELFKMKDAESAFGIFSVLRHNCGFAPELDDYHCLNKYQLQVVRGSYYVSIINSSGDETAQKVSRQIAGQLVPTIPQEKIVMPSYSVFDGREKNLIFLKGKIALGNVYPQALEYLEEIPNFNLWLLPSEHKKVCDYGLIHFTDQVSMSRYFEMAFPGKPTEGIVQIALKNKGLRIAKRIGMYEVIQAEGNLNKESKKMFELMPNKKVE